MNCGLVQAMDRNGDGRLDAGEFRDAMNKLGMANLTGTTVSTILEAMDIHGPITLEDFLVIVEVGPASIRAQSFAENC